MRIPASEFKHGIALRCGCTASGTVKLVGETEWFVGCLIHECLDVVEEESKPDLTGRMARCSYGGNEVPSSWNLAFFRHRPERDHDEYYCGCYGWD